MADEALRKALVNLDAVDAHAGEMTVVLGPGWPAVLLHEAIGHGLEGDFNRKKSSAFSGLMGEKIAADGITIVDDGTLKDRRGARSPLMMKERLHNVRRSSKTGAWLAICKIV